LYNICGTRGHFLMENVNFDSQEGITFDLFRERFYEVIVDVIEILDRPTFEQTVLRPLFEQGKLPKKEITSLKNTGMTENAEALMQVLCLLSGYKATPSKISESIALPDVSGTVDLLTLIKRDELNDFLEGIIELHDMVEVSKI